MGRQHRPDFAASIAPDPHLTSFNLYRSACMRAVTELAWAARHDLASVSEDIRTQIAMHGLAAGYLTAAESRFILTGEDHD